MDNLKKSFTWVLVLAGAITGVILPIQAQTEQGLEAQEEAFRLLEEEEKRQQTQEGLDRYKRIKGGPVTLSEIMRDPDNIDLNYRYAQTQVADSNLRGASATLERILLLNPGLVKIRLFYTYVLYRLDNRIEVEAQLAMLERIKLTAKQQEEVEQLEQRLTHRVKRTRITMTLGAGLAFQRNANFAPESERVDAIVDVFGVPVAVPDVPTTPKEDDLSYLATANLGFTHDLAHPDGHYLFGSVSGYLNEQVTVDNTDYNTVTANLGGVYQTSWGNIVGQVRGGHFRLNDDGFLNYYGFDIDFRRDFMDGALKTNFRHSTTFEDYDVTSGVTEERTGPRFEFELGARYQLTKNQILGGAIMYTKKDADEPWREFDGFEVKVNHLLHVNGYTVRNSIGYSNEDYDANNPRISLITRDDDDFRYQFTFSSPLRRLFAGDRLPRAIGGIRMDASLIYTDASSNIQNFEYDNLRGQIFFSKKFDL